MPRPSFEVWAPSEIERLRSEASALEKTLALYLRSSVASPTDGPVSPRPNGLRPNGNTSSSGRVSKYEPLMQLWAKASGDNGVTMNELDQTAAANGYRLERHVLRSIIYQQRKVNRVTVNGDRYVWHTEPQVGSPPDDEAPEPEIDDDL